MQNSIYGNKLPEIQAVLERMTQHIVSFRKMVLDSSGIDPVEHCLARIKSEESMREKCRQHGLPETQESALDVIHDAIGIRVVCAFLDDVYLLRDYLLSTEELVLIKEKDYIRTAKPNGYRSLHVIFHTSDSYYVEFQLRTISMDTWAALEHHLKYKKSINGNEDLIVDELKRCADELASTDISMQTLKNMIFERDDHRRL